MTCSKLITLSFNPAIDTTLYLSGIQWGEENFTVREHFEAAGKGPNVSRCLLSYGTESQAFVLVGRENADMFLSKLRQDGVSCSALETEGAIRENISLIIPGKPVTRIIRRGFTVTPQLRQQMLEKLQQVLEPGCLVVVSGRLPEGMSGEDLVDFCGKLTGTGAKIALDTSSLTLEQFLAIRPEIAKPNREELAQMVGMPLMNIEQIRKAAARFWESGISHVLVSLGREGMLYCSAQREILFTVPTVKVETAVGAGDSLLAMFLHKQRQGASLEESLRWACAAGTASCMRQGTNPPLQEDMEELYPRILVKELR